MDAADDLRRCSTFVESACAALCGGAPAALDACCGELSAAIHNLTALRPSLVSSRGDPEALAEAWHLRRAARRASALLENARAYHEQWTGRVNAQAAGYGPDGAPAALAHPGRVWLRG